MSRIRPRRACSSTWLLELGALRADFLEPGRDDDGPLDARLDALADHAGDGRRGVTMTARSTGSGIAPMWGYDRMPSTLGRLGLTG